MLPRIPECRAVVGEDAHTHTYTAHTYTPTHIHIQTYTHTLIHTYTHTHIHTKITHRPTPAELYSGGIGQAPGRLRDSRLAILTTQSVSCNAFSWPCPNPRLSISASVMHGGAYTSTVPYYSDCGLFPRFCAWHEHLFVHDREQKKSCKRRR